MSIYDIEFDDIKGNKRSLAEFKDKVLLIVNTASKCGFTPQLKGLQELNDKYSEQGLVIIGFPCNQFGHQDPKGNDDISEFCTVNYGVKFVMASKIDVNGKKAHPLYVYLKDQKTGVMGKGIKWNFTKFVVDRTGAVVQRFAPTVAPSAIDDTIAQMLRRIS